MRWHQPTLDTFLSLPADWPLSAEIRVAAEALLAGARPRVNAALREWVVELLPRQPANPAVGARERALTLSYALDNRLRNEMALNSLDTAGPSHDAWRADVQATAGWCRTLWTGPVWGEVLLQIERLPAGQRSAAMEHEREVLSRWGQTRPAVPARPAFSLDAYAAVLLTRVSTGLPKQRPPVAMVPVVAATLLKDQATPLNGNAWVDPPERNVRCAALQWALANARAERAATPADLEVAFRHALISRAEDEPWAKSAADERDVDVNETSYPRKARRRDLTGTVTVQVTRDDAGRITDTRVVSRDLRAPGLEGRRPVFFETMLDAASLARARALPAQGSGERKVNFVWALN